MTSRTAWIASSALVFLSLGVSVFSIFTAAHEETLARRLKEQRETLLGDQEVVVAGSMSPPFGGFSPTSRSSSTSYRIHDGRVYFTPALVGKEPASKRGFSPIHGRNAAPIKDKRLLGFLAEEILRFRKIYGPFQHDVEVVELRHWQGAPFCSKVHGQTGMYRMVVDRGFYGPETIRSLAHEVTHLAAPFLFSWYMEGLADLRGDEA